MTERSEPIDRRTLLRGAVAVGALGLAGGALAGCGGSDDEGGSTGGGGSSAPDGGSQAPTGLSVAVADVPVGGGVILTSAGTVVVTQPEAGTFKAFNGTCTHQGCPVTSVSSGQIGCDCHGSAFSIADGAVVNGPAKRPLAEKTATVEGDQVVIT